MPSYGKSSHEIVAQIKEAGVFFGDLSIEDDESRKLKNGWNEIRNELDSYSKEQISEEKFKTILINLGKKALDLGVIDPNYGQNSKQRQEYAEKIFESWGIYSDEQIKDLSVKSLSGLGLNHGIKELIKDQESAFNDAIESGINQITLERAIESKDYESILKKTIDISTINEHEKARLSTDFSSGNFLYHGAKTSSIVKILKSGAIMNGQALNKLGDPETRNSGFEGISWSINEIEALPGDRRHIAGFITAPETILDPENQLAIPSRPAPYEVIQISSSINADKYYTTKTQLELYRMVNGVEANSVFSNFVAIMNADLDHRYTPKLYKAKGDLLKDPDYPDKLRKLYKINDDNTIHLSSDLLQQKTNEIPVGAVWLQAAIDQKRFKNTPYANKNLVEIIDYLNKDNISDLLSIAKADWQNNEKIIEDIENSNSDIAVPLEQVYLVAAKRDIDSWLKVISCCEHKPAGILLYDHNNVRLENFLSDHKGDNDKLTAELRSAISPNDGYIEYSKILGREFTDNMRAGNKNHVIAEKFLDNRHIIKKINNKITIV